MTKDEYLAKATAAFAVSDTLRYSYQDRNLGALQAALQATAAALIAIAQQAVIINKRLAYIGACLADIAKEVET